MPSIIAVTVWRFAPYFMVVFLAGLLGHPGQIYYEAAQLDGARCAPPLLACDAAAVVRRSSSLLFVVSALLCARIFLLPYFITGGGPGNATRVLSMLIYDTGFSYLEDGAGGGHFGRAVRDHDGVHGAADAPVHARRGGV